MKRSIVILFPLVVVAVLLLAYTGPSKEGFKMPWKAAGLTERQAAAHLLSRFTFGARPGDVDEVVKTGLEKWFTQQLEGKQAEDDSLTAVLKTYDALGFSNQQVLNVFPRPAKILKNAVEEGVISKEALSEENRAAYKDQLAAYMQQKGYRKEQELYRQFASQKILTAAYSNNQLHQVLTEFWFNHFNVAASKNDCAQFIPAYERDVIRPNVTGKFEDLLLATAQSPAMLFYLDNFNSSGSNQEVEAAQQKRQQQMERLEKELMTTPDSAKAKRLEKLRSGKKNEGLNENYAREIMELHTLGVDGGYTQADVTEAARVLTGWTVYPLDGMGAGYARKLIDQAGEANLIAKGFVHKGDFFFALNRHDDKAKTVLGKSFAAGGGYEEGVALIQLLAHHPSTARFIAKKLAVRFVNDNAPASLIDKLASSFTKSDGDIKQVLITMVSSPEFWQKESLREKTKSPFELVVSTVRAVDADIDQPFLLYQWITKMGQRLYYYQAPTGFPDRGQYWINTGSLLNRMKFGLAFASQKIPGVHFNLAALNHNREPESALEALRVYSKIMLPERDLEATVKRLEPLVNDPALQQKVEQAATKQAPAETAMNDTEPMMAASKNMSEDKLATKMFRRRGDTEAAVPLQAGNNSLLGQVVGIIIGSPEFQRR